MPVSDDIEELTPNPIPPDPAIGHSTQRICRWHTFDEDEQLHVEDDSMTTNWFLCRNRFRAAGSSGAGRQR